MGQWELIWTIRKEGSQNRSSSSPAIGSWEVIWYSPSVLLERFTLFLIDVWKESHLCLADKCRIYMCISLHIYIFLSFFSGRLLFVDKKCTVYWIFPFYPTTYVLTLFIFTSFLLFLLHLKSYRNNFKWNIM